MSMENCGTYQCEYEDLSNNYAFYDEGVLKHNQLPRLAPTKSTMEKINRLVQIYIKAIKEQNSDSGYTLRDNGKIKFFSN